MWKSLYIPLINVWIFNEEPYTIIIILCMGVWTGRVKQGQKGGGQVKL